MSRSRRKTPIVGNAVGASDKADKRAANRKFRAKVRQLARNADIDTEYPTVREVSDVWDFCKDGKRYVCDMDAQGMRK